MCRTALVVFLFSIRAAYAATELTAGSVTGISGTVVRIPVQITTTDNPVAAQFDVVLDPRLTTGDAVAGNALAGHVVVSGSPSNGVKRIVIYHAAGSSFTSGLLVDLPVTVEEEVPEGVLPVLVTNVTLVTAQGSRIPITTITAGSLFAVSPPRFDNITQLIDGRMLLSISATVGRSYQLQASEDLVRWNTLSTNLAALGLIQVSDPTALTLNRRFYRLVTAP